jgi:hypothetical protein
MLNYNTRFSVEEIDDRDLERQNNLKNIRDTSYKWFTQNWLKNKLINKYEYFGTFNFDKTWVEDKSFEDISNSIKHFKNILGRKMFGRNFNRKSVHVKLNTNGTKYKFEIRDNFKLNFYPVIETVKWKPEFDKYVQVTPHVHILFGEVPKNVRLKKDFETFVVDCWLTLKESSNERTGKNGQQMKVIYGTSTKKCGEGYITKLNDKKCGVDFLDKKNITDVKQIFDEDISDFIDRNSNEIFNSNVTT